MRLLALLLASLLFSKSVLADGTLTQLSGQVAVQKADGSSRPAAIGLRVQQGDSLITGADGFVRMQMTDGGQMVLRPASQIKIERYHFEQAQPEQDHFVFSALKGGFRAITGLISKRGNRDAYQANTRTATLGIRGTEYDLQVCEPGLTGRNSCASMADGASTADGTYVAVIVGAIVVSNELGYINLTVGQFGFVPPNLPPVVLTRDPGISFMLPSALESAEAGALECAI